MTPDHLMLDPEHHERQAAAHLATLERDAALELDDPTYIANLQLRAQMAQGHATLALSLRARPEAELAYEGRHGDCTCRTGDPTALPTPHDDGCPTTAPTGTGTFLLELPVTREDGGPLPTARELIGGIQEGLPEEWFSAGDGDDFHLDGEWKGAYR